MNINQLIAKANNAGFEEYSSFPDADNSRVENLTMTALEGQHDGEVIEAAYEYATGNVVKVSQYSQFLPTNPHYKAPTFSIQ